MTMKIKFNCNKRKGEESSLKWKHVIPKGMLSRASTDTHKLYHEHFYRHVCVCACACACMYVYVYIYVCMHVCMYIYTHKGLARIQSMGSEFKNMHSSSASGGTLVSC